MVVMWTFVWLWEYHRICFPLKSKCVIKTAFCWKTPAISGSARCPDSQVLNCQYGKTIRKNKEKEMIKRNLPTPT